MSQAPGLTLTLARQGNQGYTITVGSAALPEITINIAALTPEQKANEHLGGRLLLSAVLACFTNTLAADLTQAGVDFNTITASASIEKEKDSALRTHYSHIELNVQADAPAAQAAAFESVRQGLLGGSLVTYSLEQGIDFTYEIEQGDARPFDQTPAAAAAPPVQTKTPAPVKTYSGGEGVLVIINALHSNLAARLRLAAGDETPNLLLVSDGAYLARPGGLETLAAGELGKVFVDAQALASRGLSASEGIESVDDDRMASLIVEEATRVIRI